MKIQAEIITFLICVIFALLGFFDSLLSEEPFNWFWVVSFLALIATIGIDLIDRVEFTQNEG